MASEKLAGQVALVTGASSGIGRATALALAGAGARVAAVARRADRLDALVAEISDAGGEATAVEADVTDEAAITAAVRSTHGRWGRLDMLVNNAGVMLLGPIEGADTAEWRRMLSTNALGLMYPTHAALPLMRAAGRGHIVNVSSVAGRTARAGVGAYNASKWAVNAFSEALRQECVPHHIRVTVIEPGIVATELQEHITHAGAKADIEKRLGSMTPLQADDVAAAILYAVTQPPHVAVNEIMLRPTEQLL